MLSLLVPFLFLAAGATAANPVAIPGVGAVATAAAGAASKVKAPVTSATLSPDVARLLQSYAFTHKTTFQQNYGWLTHALAAFFLIFAVSLIALLAVQTTKQEGLSGTIGGRVESAYRPRLGFDQQLARVTSFVAIGMVFCGVVLSITGI